jgi:hypothetical protein
MQRLLVLALARTVSGADIAMHVKCAKVLNAGAWTCRACGRPAALAGVDAGASLLCRPAGLASRPHRERSLCGMHALGIHQGALMTLSQNFQDLTACVMRVYTSCHRASLPCFWRECLSRRPAGHIQSSIVSVMAAAVWNAGHLGQRGCLHSRAAAHRAGSKRKRQTHLADLCLRGSSADRDPAHLPPCPHQAH